MEVEHPVLVEYRKSLPSKLELLRKLVHQIQQEQSLSSLEALRFQAHKLSGSSGTYGYTTASDLCKQLNLDLLEKIKNFKQDIFSEAWLLSLDLFLQKIEKAFSVPDKKIIM